MSSAIITQWEDWLAAVTDRLFELDDRARTAGTDDDRADMATAFVVRKAVAERVAEMAARPADAAKLAAAPVADASGPVAADLEGAATMLGALVARVTTSVHDRETAQASVAATLAAATADLARARTLSRDLGLHGQRVAELDARLAGAGGDGAQLAPLATAVAALRAELERDADERADLLRRWPSVGAKLRRLAEREAEVRAVVEHAREKVTPVPNLAVPSVDAVGEPPAIESLESLPWPAARAAIEPMLTTIDRLGRALDEVERRYAEASARRDELRGLLHAYRDKAAARGLSDHPLVAPRYREAQQVLWTAPCDLVQAATLVDTYLAAVNRAETEQRR